MTENAKIQFQPTDLGNAKRFAHQHGQYARYVPAKKNWYLYDGHRWIEDVLDWVYHLAESTIQSIYRDASQLQDDTMRRAIADHAKRSESSRSIKSMLELAARQMDLATPIDSFDQHPMLLNVQNGTVDLATGELRQHSNQDMISKISPVRYDPSATCPKWERFLSEIMSGDHDMVSFLQRAVGYTLTGRTDEQCLFFLYGHGANGKSTFVETVKLLMGDYGGQAEFNTFIAKENDGIRNDLAVLAGARFVSASENKAGRKFDEALVKQVTGKDTIAARFLYRELFEFKPHFKVWLSGNHKPVVVGDDDGIWRRLILIPFSVRIPEASQNRQLDRELIAELPGILNWAIAGCMEWQRQGLMVPHKVRNATADYKSEMDTIGLFLSEQCTIDPNARCRHADLYARYMEWCMVYGEIRHKQAEFRDSLIHRGFEYRRMNNGRNWIGIHVDTTYPV